MIALGTPSFAATVSGADPLFQAYADAYVEGIVVHLGAGALPSSPGSVRASCYGIGSYAAGHVETHP